ncbi:hypothetical protein H0H93_014486, partial [Arthromyces matolae]
HTPAPPVPPIPPPPVAPAPYNPVFANPTEVTMTDLKATLPSLAVIPTLRSSADWVNWESAVFRVVGALGLRGYICRIPLPGELRDPTSRVVLPPHYDFDSPPEVAEEYRVFWLHNDVVEHVVVGKLAPEIAASLPPKRTGPYDLPTRTARDTLTYLRSRFSVGSASTAESLKDGVVKLTCAPGTVPKFVESWRYAAFQLVGSPWDFTEYQKTQRFVDGLPNTSGWMVLKDRVRRWWQFHNSLEGADFTFDSLATKMLDIYTKWKSQNPQSTQNSQPRKPSASSEPSSDSSKPTTPSGDSSSNTRSTLKCTNCTMTGHTADRCWQKGGGMESGRDPARSKPRANV